MSEGTTEGQWTTVGDSRSATIANITVQGKWGDRYRENSGGNSKVVDNNYCCSAPFTLGGRRRGLDAATLAAALALTLGMNTTT